MAAGLLNKWFTKNFRKTIFLDAQENGTFEAVDITESKEYIKREDSTATIVSPALIFPVSGIKNVAYIAIKTFNQSTLLNPFGESGGLSEKALWNIIDSAEAYGRTWQRVQTKMIRSQKVARLSQ
jgi:hypothetical protein